MKDIKEQKEEREKERKKYKRKEKKKERLYLVLLFRDVGGWSHPVYWLPTMGASLHNHPHAS